MVASRLGHTEILAQKKRWGGTEEAKKEVWGEGRWINVDLHLVTERKVLFQEEADLVVQYFVEYHSPVTESISFQG